MLEEKEMEILIKAVEAVEFVNNKKESDLLAKVSGVENDDKLKRLRFADSLRSELMDLLHDEKSISESVCPPLSIDWRATIKDNKESSGLQYVITQALMLSFRAGYYYAMTDVGGSWQPADRYNKEYLEQMGMEVVPAVDEFKDME